MPTAKGQTGFQPPARDAERRAFFDLLRRIKVLEDDPGSGGPGGEPLLNDHLIDTVDAHDASAVSFVPTGTISATNVQAAIAEVAAEAGTGGASGPAGGVLAGTYPNPSFAVDMATQAELNTHAAAAVMDGDAAGGVLTGTYPNPTFAVDMATQSELNAAIAAIPAGDEVFIGPTDPGATAHEVWYDTDGIPAPPLQEVFIGPATPTDPNVELWVDEDEFPVALKAKIGGGWVGVGGAEEVTIGPDDPIATVPTTELWYDTDAPAGLTGVGIPSAGTTGQVLTKTTNTDYDASWSSRLARGLVAAPAMPAGSTQVIPVGVWTDLTGLSVTWTADPTRYYRTMLQLTGDKATAAGTVYAAVTTGAGGFIAIKAAQIALGEVFCMETHSIESGLSGSQTRKGQLNISSGTANIYRNAGYLPILMVEDVGAV